MINLYIIYSNFKMTKTKGKCPYKITMNDEPTCKEFYGLCLIKDYKDCKLYRDLKINRG